MDSIPRSNDSLLSESADFAKFRTEGFLNLHLSKPETRSAESSANKNKLQLRAAFMSLIHTRNSNGPGALSFG